MSDYFEVNEESYGEYEAYMFEDEFEPYCLIEEKPFEDIA